MVDSFPSFAFLTLSVEEGLLTLRLAHHLGSLREHDRNIAKLIGQVLYLLVLRIICRDSCVGNVRMARLDLADVGG